MGILGDKALQVAIEHGDIRIFPTPEEIKAASIDLSVGEEAFVASGEEVIRLEKGKLLVLPAGELALVITRESLQFGDRFVGHIGFKVFLCQERPFIVSWPSNRPWFQEQATYCTMQPESNGNCPCLRRTFLHCGVL